MIRRHRERVLVRMALRLFFIVWALLPWAVSGGESTQKTEAEKKAGEPEEKKKKKKIPPFKCSAWCSFISFADRLKWDPEQMKKRPSYDEEKDEHTRDGSYNWGGYARRGQWVSLVVEIQNTTEDKPYAGNIRVQLDPSRVSSETGEKPYTTRYRQAFELAPKTTQSFNFCVLCPEFDFSSVEIRITANGRLYQRVVSLYDLDGRDHDEDLIVVVSDRAAAFKFLTDMPKESAETLPGRAPAARHVAVVQPEDLPNRWYNLTLASLIIIDGPPRDGLTDEQIEAVRGYCQAGGNVMISSGLDPARLRTAEGRESSLADLVGMRVRDLKRVRQLDIVPGWVPEENDTGLSVVDVTPKEKDEKTGTPLGAVTVRRNEQTGLVERLTRQVGLGSITFFAFSLSEPKLKTWGDRSSIPLMLLEESRRRTLFAYQEKKQGQMSNTFDAFGFQEEQAPQEPIDRFRATLDGSFSEDTPVETPKRGVVASFLLLYLLVAVPLNYFIFGWFRRREIAWAAVPLWALFFSIGAYVVGYQQGRLTVDQLTVVEAGPNQPTGLARTFMGVYAPRRGNYQFRFEPNERLGVQPQAGPGHLVSRKFRTRGITGFLPEMDVLEEPGGELIIEDLLVYARSTRRLEIQHRAPLGEGIDVNLEKQDDGKFKVSVQNRSPFLLLSSVLAYRGADGRWRGIRVGNLKKNMSVPEESMQAMGPSDGQSIEDAFFSRPPYFPSGGGQTSIERAKALGAFVQSRLNRYRDTLLLAWVDGGMLPVTITRGTRVAEDVERGMTLLILPIGEAAGGGSRNWGGRFTTDRARLAWQEFSLKNGPVPIAQTDSTKGETYVELQAPRGIRDLTSRRLALTVQLRAMSQQEYAQRTAEAYNYYNNMPDVPGQYSGDLEISICNWTSNLTTADWRPVHRVSVRRLRAGERQDVTFNCGLDDQQVGPRGTILLRVQLTNMSMRGEWSEKHWPLDLLTFQPDVTGRDARRR